MNYDFITSGSDQSVTTITLNRPEVLNSFNRRMAQELQRALRDAADDKAVRAVLLTGAGRAFCAGQDLAEATSGDLGTTDLGDLVKASYSPIARAIREMEKPVVCAVNGVAAGAGANLALACDIVIAAEDASFIQSFSKIGLVPDTSGSFFLPRLVGPARATALMFLLGKFLIGFYLGQSNLASTFGAAGSVITILLWVYYSSQIVLFGAEFTKAYAELRGSRSARGGCEE